MPGGKVVVSAPTNTSSSFISNFVGKHHDWIEKHVKRLEKFSEVRVSLAQEKKLFAVYKSRALAVASAKVLEWNAKYQFPVGKIAIRNSKSRWGSCSSKGTLSFNYKIFFLPEILVDYLVVHELAHLQEKNHGKNFWALVGKEIVDYKSCRTELKKWEFTSVPRI